MARRFIHRHQAPAPHGGRFKAALGGALGIVTIGLLGQVSGMPLLIAPLGATAVLLFCMPDSPLSQPVNVIGGHVVATVLALALSEVLPPTWWGIGMAVGVAIFAMMALRIVHPPAGADPILVLLGGYGLNGDGLQFLAAAVAGGVALVAVAVLIHRLPPHRGTYPLHLP